jgi:nitroreductase
VLAPSSHNTQPWRFDIGDGVLELHADRSRALPVNDPHDRELTISCGAALLNARLAAGAAGARLDVEILPAGGASDLLARARVLEGGAWEERLCAAIPGRRTFRGEFSGRPVPVDARAALSVAAAAEGARLEVLDDRRRAPLVALVGEGDRAQFADPRWRRELAAWIRPRHAGDGLTYRGASAVATRFVLRHFDVGARVARRDARLAAGAPVLALLATTTDTPADWLVAGQALQRVLLTATALGLQASYVNQPVQVAALRPRVARLLSQPGRPQVALRLGYPRDAPGAAVRRPLEAVLRTT